MPRFQYSQYKDILPAFAQYLDCNVPNELVQRMCQSNDQNEKFEKSVELSKAILQQNIRFDPLLKQVIQYSLNYFSMRNNLTDDQKRVVDDVKRQFAEKVAHGIVVAIQPVVVAHPVVAAVHPVEVGGDVEEVDEPAIDAPIVYPIVHEDQHAPGNIELTEDEYKNECSITSETYYDLALENNLVATKCDQKFSHKFSRIAITEWLNGHPGCPMCRRAVAVEELVPVILKD